MEFEFELKCDSCGVDRPTDHFMRYQEVILPSGVHTVHRQRVDRCRQCRANRLIENNLMPDDMHEAELVDGVWDYTAKYRRSQEKLSNVYSILQAKTHLQQKAEANAIKRRVEYIRADVNMMNILRVLMPGIFDAGDDKINQWLTSNGVCLDCHRVKSSLEFIALKKRKSGNRYEFKQRCNACREAYRYDKK